MTKYGYYIVINSDAFKDLCKRAKPQEVCDFIYLACHGNGINCVASPTSNNSIGEKLIYKLLGRDGVKRLQTLINLGVVQERGLNYQLNYQYVTCKKRSLYKYRDGIKIYKHYFISLYKNLNSREQDILGRIYKMHSSVNVCFNLLCKDIYNTDLKWIEPYRRADVVKLAGFCKGHDSLYSKKLTDLKFEYNSFQFRVVLHGIKESDFCGGYFINPLLFYRGKDIDAALDIKVKTKSGKRIGYAILDDEED